MRTFITGSSGYIGKRLLEVLTKRGDEIHALYSSWELFFRGFMLFGLRRCVGDWMAICMQMIPQCLWHIGMPSGELFSSIAAGILFGVIAIRTGSILWSFVLHDAIGITLDLLILAQH